MSNTYRISATNEQEIADLLASNEHWIDQTTGKPMIKLVFPDGYEEIEELARTVYCLAYVNGEECLGEQAVVKQICEDPTCIDPEHLVLVN